ncbi:MAG: polysaccharide biosynthesis/export family protein [Bacteroidota bacterium]
MFSHDKKFVSAQLTAEARSLESNYVIKPNDLLSVKVYTKKGEMIIDPEYELNKNINMNRVQRPDPEYLVGLDGMVFLPMVEAVKLEGLTIHEANLKLIDLYSEYFVDPYVITTYTNKRVTLLGAPGGQIIPLINENITIAEVLATAGGLGKVGNASKMKLIRGEEVFLIDFSTVEGYFNTNQLVKAGDIIYIEPINRVVADNANTFALILSAITTTTALLVLFMQ